MMLNALALAALMARCAPNVAPSTMLAIVSVESGGDSLAIGDNTAKRSYYPPERKMAERLARQLLDAGHVLDLGLAQIDSVNFSAFRVNVHSIFDPCTNLSVGGKILSDNYAIAIRRYGSSQIALRRAIGMYNTGRLNGGARYIRRVLAAAGIHDKDETPSLLALPQRKYPEPPARTASVQAAMPSPTLVPLEGAYRKSVIRHRAVVTPARSPILIRVARRPRAEIF